MARSVKCVHTNLVARDWKLLADLYIKVFGCLVKPPERNLKGDWLGRLTLLKNGISQAVAFQPLHDPGPSALVRQGELHNVRTPASLE